MPEVIVDGSSHGEESSREKHPATRAGFIRLQTLFLATVFAAGRYPCTKRTQSHSARDSRQLICDPDARIHPILALS